MNRLVWDTREPVPARFASAWNERLASMPHANFSMRLDFVRWEAQQDRHALLVLAEEDGRRGALVMRTVGRELHCGWPWRWQAGVEAPDPEWAPALAPDAAAWLFGVANLAVRGRRLRCFLPGEPPAAVSSYIAGATIVQSIDHDDDTLRSGMSASKRRLFKRAEKAGFHVREARDTGDFSRFRELQLLAERLRDDDDPEEDALPSPGHGFREWELPWMNLLIATQGDELVAGVGDGLLPGGIVEGRAAAVSFEARSQGVMALLCHHEARWLRDRGHAWLNHGGDTMFKREVAGSLGRRLLVHCWLGGGPRWTGVNTAEAWARRARPQVASWVRKVKPSPGKKSGAKTARSKRTSKQPTRRG